MSTTGVYKKTLSAILGGDLDLVNARLVVARLSLATGYDADLDADEYLAELPSGTILGELILIGKSLGPTGEFKADDAVFIAVPDSEQTDAILIYHCTGFPNSSRLLYYSDNAPGLPVVGDGGDISIQWPDPLLSFGG